MLTVGRIFYVCNDALTQHICKLSTQNDSMLKTSLGSKRADTLVGTTPAAHLFSGVDVNGDLIIQSFFGGEAGNQLQVSLDTGPTGVGNESLPLRLTTQGSPPVCVITVLFATDIDGVSITPTASAVANLLNTDPAVDLIVEGILPGTGNSNVVGASLTNLSGGLNTGDWLKFDGHIPVCRQIHRVEVS